MSRLTYDLLEQMDIAAHVPSRRETIEVNAGRMADMTTELRQRRAADLTAEEREALRDAKLIIQRALNPVEDDGCPCSECEKHRSALTALDKLLTDGGGK